MSKHFQNARTPYLHPSICMWKACICRCQDFTKGQTEPKPWDSNISEGLRSLVFTALVYVIVGDKKVRWFSAEINPSRVGVCFGFGHFCQMALSGCLTWLVKLHTYTFCSHLKWRLLYSWSRYFTLLESLSTELLWGTFQHDQPRPGMAW